MVALTGGIGSGKTTVVSTSADLGVNVIGADIIACQAVELGISVLKAIEKHFSSDVIAADGLLQRRVLYEHIFSNPEKKNWLNTLFCPLIQWETQCQFRQATPPYLPWVVPLLVGNSLYEKVGRVLVVDVTSEIQLRHITQCGDVMREHTEQILAVQTIREARPAVADDVIDNNGAPEATASGVTHLHALYL